MSRIELQFRVQFAISGIVCNHVTSPRTLYVRFPLSLCSLFSLLSSPFHLLSSLFSLLSTLSLSLSSLFSLISSQLRDVFYLISSLFSLLSLLSSLFCRPSRPFSPGRRIPIYFSLLLSLFSPLPSLTPSLPLAHPSSCLVACLNNTLSSIMCSSIQPFKITFRMTCRVL